MKLYAICWQDTMEPWGWAADECYPNAPEQRFFWDRAHAEVALENHLKDHDEETSLVRWSVQTYEVPTPPAIERVRRLMTVMRNRASDLRAGRWFSGLVTTNQASKPAEVLDTYTDDLEVALRGADRKGER